MPLCLMHLSCTGSDTGCLPNNGSHGRCPHRDDRAAPSRDSALGREKDRSSSLPEPAGHVQAVHQRPLAASCRALVQVRRPSLRSALRCHLTLCLSTSLPLCLSVSLLLCPSASLPLCLALHALQTAPISTTLTRCGSRRMWTTWASPPTQCASSAQY